MEQFSQRNTSAQVRNDTGLVCTVDASQTRTCLFECRCRVSKCAYRKVVVSKVKFRGSNPLSKIPSALFGKKSSKESSRNKHRTCFRLPWKPTFENNYNKKKSLMPSLRLSYKSLCPIWDQRQISSALFYIGNPRLQNPGSAPALVLSFVKWLISDALDLWFCHFLHV